MHKIFYVDPMSYGNLASYDYYLLSKINDGNIFFFGNVKYDEKELGGNISFYPIFKYSDYKTKFAKFLSYTTSVFRLLWFLIKEKPQIIHIQWFKIHFVDLILCRILKLRNIKLVYTVHNILPHDSGISQVAVYQKYYDYADVLLVHTKTTKLRLATKFNLDKNKIFIIPHGLIKINVNTEKVTKLVNYYCSLKQLKGKIIFSSLGVQSTYKGCDLIAELWSKESFLFQNEKIVLLIMGKNKNVNYDDLKDIKNVFIVDRFITNEEFLAAIKITNLLFMPYREISQSGLLMTAIGEKTPVLVSSAGELEAPLKIENIGWSMGIANYDNFKLTMLQILNDKNHLINIKNDVTAWNNLCEHYSWTEIGKQTADIYKKILD